jgi:branched-chain amino acid transport system ATP-binding protein
MGMNVCDAARLVALGRAMMLSTKLLLLDEPFQGLAPLLAD